MKRLGKVSHYAKQGFLIVRTTWVPSLNDKVIDKNLRFVGIVKDVFGPVKAPYVAIKPKVKDPEKYVGEVLYIDTRKKKKEKKQMRRKKKF
ncbi:MULTISPECIES: Gar1/Naf1 family protein [Thermococcaceae]|uniref:Gar1-like small nucleolar rnp n=2 Tax=Thermococcaceae TaxID=2259 RepID=A0A170SXH7_9EURY|nr:MULTISPECIES: Gar1/Naf1 family protein [Thermococcaceae]AMM54434.1 H/ACA RNA-protein complex protein Gar1 [Pyrococcus kukulkanii]ASJ16219.1 H/ACA RNA-protein complex protein Gar1 [Thermococcus chitonophagus]CUX78809.1 gar1-like small nucleolar rnp [Thermococcus chitonophagus]